MVGKTALKLSYQRNEKITQMIGRQKSFSYLQTNLDRNSELCLETRGQQVVVRLPFHSSTRIRLKNMGQIKDTKKNVLGMKCRAKS